MGVSGLTAFVKDNRNSVTHSVHLPPLSEQDKREYPPHTLVVDAWSFIYSLYAANLPTFSGGEYLAFNNLIKRVCSAWARVGIQPYFVFDGPTPPSKRKLVKARLEQRLQTARLFYRTSPASRSSLYFSTDAIALPPFLYHVTRDTLAELCVPAYYLVEGEADGYCAALANELGGWVLSGDSDFAIYRSTHEDGYKGWVPIDAVQWMDEKSAGASSHVDDDDGFSVVKKGRAREAKAGATNLASLLPPRVAAGQNVCSELHHPTLVLTVISPSDLAARLRIPTSHLALFATLAGSDHTPSNASGLFFDWKANAVDRIEKVARVLREALSPLGQERMKKQMRLARIAANSVKSAPGSPSTGASGLQSPNMGQLPVHETPLVAGDHAEAFVDQVVKLMMQGTPAPGRRAASRISAEVEAKLVQDIIEATCHYILPVSPSQGADGHCCATFPFCLCSGGAADGASPVGELIRRRELYADQRRRGHMSAFSAYADPSAIWLHTGLEDPEGISPRATAAAKARRRAAWDVVVSGVGGLRELEQEASQAIDEVPEDLDLDAAAGQEAQQLGLDTNGAQGVEVIEPEVPAEEQAAEKHARAPSMRADPRVFEFLRVGASTHLGPFDLEVSKPENAAVTWSDSATVRYQLMLERVSGDHLQNKHESETSGLDGRLRILVAILRGAVRQADQEGKPWHRQECNAAVRAGIASFERWESTEIVDDMTVEHPTLENKNCVRLAQALSVALDADQLAQALLLNTGHDSHNAVSETHSFPPPYRFLDGSLWHQHFLEERSLGADLDVRAARCLSAVGAGLEGTIKGWGSAPPVSKASRRGVKPTNGKVNGHDPRGEDQARRSRYGVLPAA